MSRHVEVLFFREIHPDFSICLLTGRLWSCLVRCPSCASSIDCFLSSSRLNEHSSPYLQPSLVLYLAHSRRSQQSQEEFVHIPSMYLRQAGWFLLPDGLIPFGPLPSAPLPSPSEAMSESWERDRVGFLPFPFHFSSCLKLHESPFEHCSFREQLSAISLFSREYDVCHLRFFLPPAPSAVLSSLLASKFRPLIFWSGDQRIISLVVKSWCFQLLKLMLTVHWAWFCATSLKEFRIAS